jgi:hypothetical protein
VITAVFLIACYWFHGNSYTPLRPIQVDDSKMVVIPYTNQMIANFPDVLRYYHVPYKINDSGLFLIPVKYASDRDLVFSMTTCTLDSTQMKEVRSKP